MNLKTVNTSGKAGKEIETVLFDSSASAKTVAQAVRVFLSNQRQGTAKVKTRGEVDRTKKKWYRQKGTGGARHGARSANIFVGGGVSHGPTGLTDWTLRMSKPMKISALRTALSMQAKDGKITLVTGLDELSAKTRDVAGMLKALEFTDDKTLIVMDKTLESLVRASRNIETVLCTRADRLNTFEVMNAGRILMSPEALAYLEVRLAKKTAPALEEKTIEKPVKKRAVAKKKLK